MQPNRRSRRAAAGAVLEVLVDDRLMNTMSQQEQRAYIETQQRLARAAFERGERGVHCTMDERLAFRRASPFAPASSSNTMPAQIPVSIDPELVKGMTPAQYDSYVQMRTRQALADPDRARRDYEIDMSFGMGAATPTPTPAPAPTPTPTPAPTPAPKMCKEEDLSVEKPAEEAHVEEPCAAAGIEEAHVEEPCAAAGIEEAHAEEASQEGSESGSNSSSHGWETVYDKRVLARDELSLANDRHRGKVFYQTYGGGPEGGYATDSRGRVWPMERQWFREWTFTFLPGRTLEERTTDEGVFQCRLVGMGATPPGSSSEPESDGHDDESEEEDDEPDEAETDPMDAETVAETDAADNEMESDDSEVCNDDAHRFLQSAFMAWRIGAFNSQAPYRVFWCFYFWFRVMA